MNNQQAAGADVGMQYPNQPGPPTAPPPGWQQVPAGPPTPSPLHGPPPGWAPPLQAQQPGWAPPPGPPVPWGQPQQWGSPPRPPMLPVTPQEYPTFWRAPGIKPWRPVVAILLAGVGFFLLSAVIGAVGLVADAVISGTSFQEAALALADGTISSSIFLANSVSLGLLIPLCFLLSRLVGQRGGWLSSVAGRIRWRWLLRCFMVSFIAVAALIIVGTSLEGWDQVGLSARPGWWWLLIGVLIVTPFQAAGEEYLIRGVLNRGVASLIPGRLMGAVIGGVFSSVVFMLLHGAGDIWLNITYFGMGMLFSYLTWRTGGLEAAVAMHAANNLVALAFLPFQDIGEMLNRSAGVGDPTVLLQLVVLSITAAVIVRMSRRRSLERAAAPAAMPLRVS